MRRLSMLSILFFAAFVTASAQKTVAPESPSRILKETIKAASASLGSTDVTQRLSQSEAERFIEACSGLIELDPKSHEAYCSDNPAVAWSLAHLKLPTTKLSERVRGIVLAYETGNERVGTPQDNTKPRLDLPKDSDSREALSAAFRTEIDELSVIFYQSALRGNIRRTLSAEARLNILYHDVQETLGGKDLSLPSDPLALAGTEAVRTEITSLRAKRSHLDRFVAKFPLPDSTETLRSLDARIDRLDSILTGDQPGQFYRARDAIEAALSLTRWNQLAVSRTSRTEAERSRLEKAWSIQHPTLALSPNPPPKVQSTSEKTSPRQALSERVLEATRTYEIDPSRWLALESWLMATHAQIEALPSAERQAYSVDPMPSYPQWRASLLTDQDLALALEYSLAASNNESALLRATDEVPFAPDLADKQYRVQLTRALQDEVQSRNAGTRRERTVPPAATKNLGKDPETEAAPSLTEGLFRVRLAEGRYDSPNEMPPLIKTLTSRYIQDVHNQDLKRAADLYARLQNRNEIAALATAKLADAQWSRLEKARTDTLAALLRLDNVIKAREQKGYSWQSGARFDLSVMISSLSIRPPPDRPSDESPVGVPTPVPEPSGTPGGSAVQPINGSDSSGAPPIVHDAPLLALFANASDSIAEIESANDKNGLQPIIKGPDKGRITVSREQLHDGAVEFTKLEKDPAQARLPERLQSWRGFINPTTKKPYDYGSEVKNFKDFRPVGGGIHMGDTGRLAKTSTIEHSILTYDPSSKSLLLLGPSGEAAKYGPIEPEELKALYQFVSAGHNAAVSIGWAGEYDPDARRPGESQPILLDPYFVDTQVGQDLVAADSIPWSLHQETLPGGSPNLIAIKFKTERDRFYERQFEILQKFCNSVPAFSEVYASQLSTGFKGDTYLDLVTFSLLTSQSVVTAKASFLRETGYESLQEKRKQISSLIALYPSGGLFKPPPGVPELKTLRSQLTEIDKALEVVDWFSKLFDRQSDRLALLEDVTVLAVESPGTDAKWIRLLASILKKRKNVEDNKIGEAIYSELPTTTLAVLLDEPTEIHVDGTALALSGHMRYRYATNLLRVVKGKLVTAENTSAGINRVETIETLTSLVNESMPLLLENCPSLRRVTRYAQIAAFLRWARQSKSIVGIDLSILGEFNSSDRDKTPTPDALARPSS